MGINMLHLKRCFWYEPKTFVLRGETANRCQYWCIYVFGLYFQFSMWLMPYFLGKGGVHVLFTATWMQRHECAQNTNNKTKMVWVRCEERSRCIRSKKWWRIIDGRMELVRPSVMCVKKNLMSLFSSSFSLNHKMLQHSPLTPTCLTQIRFWHGESLSRLLWSSIYQLLPLSASISRVHWRHTKGCSVKMAFEIRRK